MERGTHSTRGRSPGIRAGHPCIRPPGARVDNWVIGQGRDVARGQNQLNQVNHVQHQTSNVKHIEVKTVG